jgi:hypothetical protein
LILQEDNLTGQVDLAKRSAGGGCNESFGEVHNGKGTWDMKTKLLLLVVVLSYAPLVVAGDEAAYPKEKVAAFVVEKLDLTSLPSAFRPKKEKGKKTIADYGFTAQTVNESKAVIEATGGVRRLAIEVLDQKPSGIYVCVVEPGENAVCPVIGGSDSSANPY